MKTLAALRQLSALSALALLFSVGARAETLTVPAVTSLPVGSAASPFFSDVRVFNTSYTAPVGVTAVYRCFLGPCPAAAPQVQFTVGPRESRAFDDMIQSAFNTPSTAGAVEFTSSGGDLRVTSRLFSPAAAGGTNGMFVPGVKASDAHFASVLPGLANGAFRTNIGFYNGNDVGVAATIRLFQGSALLGSQTVIVGPRSGTQLNRIFDVFGQGAVVTTNAYAVVESSSAAAPLFAYAAVIDNVTADSSFVAGDPDAALPAGDPAPTATPPGSAPPSPTPTPTPTTAATVVVNLTAEQFKWSFDGGGTSFVMHVGQTYEVHMKTLDVTHGFSGLPGIGLSGAALSPGAAEIVQTIRPTADQVGSHVFVCDIFCGTGHGFAGNIQIAQ
jgi:hypothetical protein